MGMIAIAGQEFGACVADTAESVIGAGAAGIILVIGAEVATTWLEINVGVAGIITSGQINSLMGEPLYWEGETGPLHSSFFLHGILFVHGRQSMDQDALMNNIHRHRF